jgi:hypothetical protein
VKLLSLLIAATLPAWGLCGSEADCRQGARQFFLDVERVSRLPAVSQEAQVTRLYREVYPQLQEYLAHVIAYRVPPREHLAPEELAARLEGIGGWGVLAAEARRRCREVLAAHPVAIRELVRADFATASRESLRRALLAVSSLRLAEFFDETLAAFRTAEPALLDPAAYTLRDLGDPRAIEPLLRKDPAHPTLYFEILRSLQRNRPPHPLLVQLLSHEDAQIRWEAAQALSEAAPPPATLPGGHTP